MPVSLRVEDIGGGRKIAYPLDIGADPGKSPEGKLGFSDSFPQGITTIHYLFHLK